MSFSSDGKSKEIDAAVRWCSGSSLKKTFTKFTGKHLLLACNFIKNEIPAPVISCEFCEIFEITLFLEQLPASAFKDTLFSELTY